MKEFSGRTHVELIGKKCNSKFTTAMVRNLFRSIASNLLNLASTRGPLAIVNMLDNALINPSVRSIRGNLVLVFKVNGPKAARSMLLDRQNKYCLYGPRSRLIRALLYAYSDKPV